MQLAIWVDNIARDVRWAVRSLRRSPSFTAVAVITLGFSIGANTAVFSAVEGVLLQPLPYRDPDQLVRIFGDVATPAAPGSSSPTRHGPSVQAVDLAALRAQTTTLSQVMFWAGFGPTMNTEQGTVRLQGARVSPDMFPMLGVAPRVGRAFISGEDAAGADAVAVLSYGLWQSRFGGSPDAVGRGIVLDDQAYTVLGVMPADFGFPDRQVELWIPFVPADTPNMAGVPIARIRNGVSRQAAAQEVGTILGQLWAAHPSGGPRLPPPVGFELVGLQDDLVAPIRPALLVLAGAVAFVLLIACVNLANLLLARAAAREREAALLVAVGATRARLAAHVITESLLLAVAGGALGIAFAYGGVHLLHVLAAVPVRPDMDPGLTLPRLDQVGINRNVLLFTVAISIGSGLLFGLAPFVRQMRRISTDALRAGASSRVGFTTSGRHRFQAWLVVAEVAMAVVLVVGASLLLCSLLNLSRVDLGYDPRHLLTAQLTLPSGAYRGNTLVPFADDVAARLEQLTGVITAGYARQLPMVRLRQIVALRTTPERPAQLAPPAGFNEPERPDAPDTRVVSQHFLKAMGVDIVAGRGFEDRDGPTAAHVMLINETLARSGFLGDRPIGQHMYAQGMTPWEVVGIVADVRQWELDRAPDPQVFFDYRQSPPPAPPPGPGATAGPPLAVYFAVRTAGDPLAIAPAFRDLVRDLEPRAVLDNVATMSDLVSNSMAGQRLYAVLLGIFAAVAVALAAVGIYGVLAYSVAQRTQEIGIRMALGAPREAVVGLVVWQAAILTVTGIASGLLMAIAVTRYLNAMLFGLTPLDAGTFVVAAVAFALVAVSAAYVPARRATMIDPLGALRSE